MKKFMISVASLGLITMFGCQKSVEEADSFDFASEALMESAMVEVQTSDYEKTVVDKIKQEFDGTVSEGTFEYTENGVKVAVVSFDGDSAIVRDSLDRPRKHKCKGKGKRPKGPKGEYADYDKVIVDPIVHSQSCDYPVAGIIEFYDNGVLIATIDFGDGTCDDLATKTTDDGTTTFTLKRKKH
jgi:hypothetical protein